MGSGYVVPGGRHLHEVHDMAFSPRPMVLDREGGQEFNRSLCSTFQVLVSQRCMALLGVVHHPADDYFTAEV